MKPYFRPAALAAIVLAVFCCRAFAQTYLPDTVRIAFVPSDRFSIQAVKLGGKPDTLFKSNKNVKFKHLAVLASTHDGKSLFMGGRVVFTNPASAQVDSIDFFGRIDSPFVLQPNDNINILANPMTIGKTFRVLRQYTPHYPYSPLNPPKALPLGVLTPDEQYWYATWQKVSPGDSVQFFKGRFDGGGGGTDSVTASGDDAAVAGFQMTNLITTADGQTLVVGLCDGFTQGFPRIRIYTWKPTASGGSNAVQTSNISGPIQALRPRWNIDSAFGFTIKHIDGSSPEQAEIGLIPNTNRDMFFYKFNITSVTLNQTSDEIPHSACPDSLHMFCGQTGNWPNLDDDRYEVITPYDGGPFGNGGDVMFSPTGDSVVFLTCRKDDYVDSVHAQIWMYSMSAHKSTLIYNDRKMMERQPIFMGFQRVLGAAPPYHPGIAHLSATQLTFPDTKKGLTNLMTTTILDQTANEVVITSIALAGTDAAAFSFSPPVPPNITIAGENQQIVSITFKPTAIKSYSAQLVIHYKDSLAQADSILTVDLNGNGIDNGGGSVTAEAEKYFSMSLVPNPFAVNADVVVTSKTSGSVSLEVVDLQGSSLYRSGERYLGSGERTTFALDAKELKLAPGSYFVVLHTTSGDVMRKAIVIR